MICLVQLIYVCFWTVTRSGSKATLLREADVLPTQQRFDRKVAVFGQAALSHNGRPDVVGSALRAMTAPDSKFPIDGKALQAHAGS